MLAGDRYAEAQQHAEALAAEAGLVFIHPFDDPAGDCRSGDRRRRDAAAESRISTRCSSRSAAAASSPASARTSRRVRPDVQVIGVEPVDADAMAQSLAAGERVRLDDVGLFADGVAVQQVGAAHFPDRARDGPDDHPRGQRRDLRRDQGHLRRHADDRGACRRAGRRRAEVVRRDRARSADGGSAAVLSGANMNFDRLRFVAERAELGEGREALLAVDYPRASRRVPRFLRGAGRAASSPSSTIG